MKENLAPNIYDLDVLKFRTLFSHIQKLGYAIAGPRLVNSAIAFDYLETFDDLPCGYDDVQGAGSYAVKKSDERSYFRYAVGPQSIKNILHPARRKLWGARKNSNEGMSLDSAPEAAKPIALFGVRSCDLKAIEVLDRVFLESGFTNEHYQSQKRNLLIIAATCIEPSSVCFCTSMGHGPKAARFDINLTEVIQGGEHRFLAEGMTERGKKILQDINAEDSDEKKVIEEIVARSVAKISKTMPTENLPQLLLSNLEHPRWNDVAERCLSCGNCTMVCPTCFCTTAEDQTDLTGEHTERWLRWDSCFTADFSFVHGGSVRKTTKSRYRQWLTHKLGTWHEQFGTSGCVGCGRCVAWCPVGIDLTEEVKAIKESG